MLYKLQKAKHVNAHPHLSHAWRNLPRRLAHHEPTQRRDHKACPRSQKQAKLCAVQHVLNTRQQRGLKRRVAVHLPGARALR